MYMWLDDVRPEPEGWARAHNIDEAKKLLATGQVEYASLDHDMGAVPPCQECLDKNDGAGCPKVSTETEDCDCKNCHQPLPSGCELVKWMIETGHWPKYKPAVHSANPVGRKDMQGMIERYGPYGP